MDFLACRNGEAVDYGAGVTPGHSMSCLLIHPPLVKPSEPPPGLALLAAAFENNAVDCRVLDANMEGILHLLGSSIDGSDTWTRRARRALPQAIGTVRNMATCDHPDRYRRAVSDINRVLASSARSHSVRLSLSDYHDDTLSPLRSGDCVRSFHHPEDNPFYGYFQKRLPPIFENSEPDVIGISLNYLSQALTAFALIGLLRRLAPSARIVVGGGLATSWKRSPAWNDPFRGIIDLWVDGPGEESLLSLARKNAPGHRSCPLYDGFSLNTYLSPGLVLPYSASRGCYWRRCTFCPENAENTLYRPLSPGVVTEELGALVRTLKPALIHFLDNALSPSLLEHLANDPPGSPWYGFARFTEHLADPAFCRDLKRSGCVMLKLGLESGSPKVLEGLRKGIDLGTVSRALRNLRAAGICSYVYLLFGTPGETESEALKTMDFTARHSDAIGFLNLAVFNLPAWSPEAQELESASFYEGDLMLYRNYVHPRGWNRPKVRQFIDRKFRRHPAVAAIVRRDPPFFTSNHAPFFASSALGGSPPGDSIRCFS